MSQLTAASSCRTCMHLFHLYLSVTAGSAGPAEISGNAAGCTVAPAGSVVKGMLTWVGLNCYSGFIKNHFSALFIISVAVSIDLDFQTFLQCWQIWNKRNCVSKPEQKQATMYSSILSWNWNLTCFSIDVSVHVVNKLENQAALIGGKYSWPITDRLGVEPWLQGSGTAAANAIWRRFANW